MGVAILGLVGHLNLRRLPRNSTGDRPTVSIIVPARDEADRIEATVTALLEQQAVDCSVIVVDDGSQDATPVLLERLAAEHPHLEVLRVAEVPDGWLGKCHACHVGAARAQGDWLLFVDADAWCADDVVGRAIAAAVSEGADHLCLLPSLGRCSFGGQAAVLLTMFAMLGIAVGVNRDLPFGYVGVGAFTLIRRSAYQAIGGHQFVRMEVIEDFAIGYRVRRHGLKTRVYMGQEEVEVRWAHSVRSFVAVLEKNMFAKLGFRVARLVAESSLMLLLWGVPIAGWFHGSTAGLAAGSAMVLAIFPAIWTALRYRWNPLAGVFAPFMLPVLVFAAMNSARRVLAEGGVRWRGVFYPLAELRAARDLVSEMSEDSGL